MGKKFLARQAEKLKIVGYSAVLGEIVTQNCPRNPAVEVNWYSAQGGQRHVRSRGRKVVSDDEELSQIIDRNTDPFA